MRLLAFLIGWVIGRRRLWGIAWVVMLALTCAGCFGRVCNTQTVAYYDLDPDTGRLLGERTMTVTVCRPRLTVTR